MALPVVLVLVLVLDVGRCSVVMAPSSEAGQGACWWPLVWRQAKALPLPWSGVTSRHSHPHSAKRHPCRASPGPCGHGLACRADAAGVIQGEGLAQACRNPHSQAGRLFHSDKPGV